MLTRRARKKTMSKVLAALLDRCGALPDEGWDVAGSVYEVLVGDDSSVHLALTHARVAASARGDVDHVLMRVQAYWQVRHPDRPQTSCEFLALLGAALAECFPVRIGESTKRLLSAPLTTAFSFAERPIAHTG